MKLRGSLKKALFVIVCVCCVVTSLYLMGAEDSEPQFDGEPFVVLDVRNKDEYDSGHVDGCIFMPVNEVQSKIEQAVPDKDTRIKVYCAAGMRAANAKNILNGMGYNYVVNLGGFSSAARAIAANTPKLN